MAQQWKRNENGFWSRVVDGNEETTAINPNATDSAREAATEAGVDINEVEGTGLHGKVTKADVEAHQAKMAS